MKRVKILFLGGAAAVLGASCGTATNAHYPGEPLASIQGTLTGALKPSPPNAISLAVAWYAFPYAWTPGAHFRGWGPAGPPSIVTQEVTYRGTFPITYTVNLFDPPPAGALSRQVQAGEPYHQAIGVILAYEDSNGNGTLDLIPTDGSAIDVILGSSVPNVARFDGPHAYLLSWISGTPLEAGWTPGYQLLLEGTPVPLSTPVPIEATSSRDLNLFVCPQLFVFPQLVAASGTACAAPPPNPALEVYGGFFAFPVRLRCAIRTSLWRTEFMCSPLQRCLLMAAPCHSLQSIRGLTTGRWGVRQS